MRRPRAGHSGAGFHPLSASGAWLSRLGDASAPRKLPQQLHQGAPWPPQGLGWGLMGLPSGCTGGTAYPPQQILTEPSRCQICIHLLPYVRGDAWWVPKATLPSLRAILGPQGPRAAPSPALKMAGAWGLLGTALWDKEDPRERNGMSRGTEGGSALSSKLGWGPMFLLPAWPPSTYRLPLLQAPAPRTQPDRCAAHLSNSVSF